MILTLNLAELAPTQIRAAAAMLLGFVAHAETEAGAAVHAAEAKLAAVVTAVEAKAETVEQTIEQEVTQAAKKVTRKPKAEAATDAAPAPAGAAPPAAITLDDLRNALQAYTAAHGMPAGVALLSRFNCKRVSELNLCDEATQAAFLKAATEAAA